MRVGSSPSGGSPTAWVEWPLRGQISSLPPRQPSQWALASRLGVKGTLRSLALDTPRRRAGCAGADGTVSGKEVKRDVYANTVRRDRDAPGRGRHPAGPLGRLS